MKKTLIALSVAALAATSANAAVVFNQDGTKVEVNGQLRLLLSKDKYERADLKYGSSRLNFKVMQDLGDGYSALGNIEVRFEDPTGNSNAYAKYLYAGFVKDGVGQITFGRLLTNLDDVGLSDFTYDLGGVNLTNTSTNKGIRFRSADFAGFQLGLDYFFGENDEAEYNHGQGFGTSLFYTAQLAQDTTLQLNAGFSQYKVEGGTFEASLVPDIIFTDHKVNAFIVGAKLASGPVELGVDYSQSKTTDKQRALFLEDAELPVTQFKALEVGTKYNYSDNASVYGEYIYRKTDVSKTDGSIKINQFILGTDYKFAKNVITYVEGSTEKWKYQDNSMRDNKFRVGLRVLF